MEGVKERFGDGKREGMRESATMEEWRDLRKVGEREVR